nr:FAD-dependent oxidoreductase [uncultured Dyadobacter sp.]
MKAIRTEVAIIGAGYSGVAAGKILQQYGRDFVIMEAQGQAGGRVKTHEIAEWLHVEFGAQWIGEMHTEIRKWIEEVNFHTYPTFDSGYHIFQYEGKKSFYKSEDDGPDLTLADKLKMLVSSALVDGLAKFIDPNNPAHSPFAKLLDSHSLASFLERLPLAKEKKFLVKQGIETSSAHDSKDISLLHALFEIRASGSLKQIIKVKGGAQELMITEGAQKLLKAISDKFTAKICFNERVYSVSQDTDGVTVRTGNFEVRAKKLIVAISPAVCGKIDFGGSISDKRKELFNKLPMGQPVKCFAIYERPFWRELGFSGQIIGKGSPFFSVSYDCSPGTGKGVLLFFVKERFIGEFTEKHPDEKKRLLMEELAKHFGAEAFTMQACEDLAWNPVTQPLTGGGYAACFPPRAWTRFGSILRRPCGHIHWAGTETATEWFAYMEGAIRAGYRAADEVRHLI